MKTLLLAWLLLASSLAAALTVQGTVRNGEGEAIASATVWLSQERATQAVTTDARGGFAFNQVAIGDIDLVAYREGYGLDGLSARVVADGEIALVLPEPASLKLRVRDSTGNPIEGARILRMRVNDKCAVEAKDLTERGFPSYRSDAEGHLEVPILPRRGFVSFTVDHLDYAPAYIAYLSVGRAELPVVLPPAVTVRGRIVTPGNAGLAAARVSVFSETSSGLREWDEPTSDPEGFFSTRLPSGDYYVAVRHVDWASPPPVPLRVLDEETTPPGQIAMRPPCALSGRVVDTEDRPMPGVDVAYLVEQVIYNETMTGLDGRFRMIIGPGKGQVRVQAPKGYVTEAPYDTQLVIADAATVDLHDLRVKPLPVLRGTVRASSGEPLPNAIVSTESLDQPLWLVTDERGRFEVMLDRVPHEAVCEWRAEHPRNFYRETFKVDFREDRDYDVTVRQFEPDPTEIRPGVTLRNNLSGITGEAAPALQCDPEGWFNTEPIALDELKGKVVVLTFWGGFDRTPAGRARLEEIRVLHAILRDTGDVVFLAVHDSASLPEEVAQYVHDERIEFPVARDIDPGVTFDAYDISFVPQTVLIDKQGTLRYCDVDGRLFDLIKMLRR